MLTFREKLTTLCDRQRNRLYQGKLNPHWCLEYHGECSSKTCRLGAQEMTIKEAYDKGFWDGMKAVKALDERNAIVSPSYYNPPQGRG